MTAMTVSKLHTILMALSIMGSVNGHHYDVEHMTSYHHIQQQQHATATATTTTTTTAAAIGTTVMHSVSKDDKTQGVVDPNHCCHHHTVGNSDCSRSQ